jgi:hypothetical protein
MRLTSPLCGRAGQVIPTRVDLGGDRGQLLVMEGLISCVVGAPCPGCQVPGLGAGDAVLPAAPLSGLGLQSHQGRRHTRARPVHGNRRLCDIGGRFTRLQLAGVLRSLSANHRAAIPSSLRLVHDPIRLGPHLV